MEQNKGRNKNSTLRKEQAPKNLLLPFLCQLAFKYISLRSVIN